MFRTEQRLGIVFATVTVIAILIAHIAAQCTKEIGIQKVLGQSGPFFEERVMG